MCQCEICFNSIKDDNIFIFPCGHMFDVVSLIIYFKNCIIRSLQESNYFMPSLSNKIEKILMLKNEIELLERRRDYNRPIEEKKKAMHDDNKDIWNSITGYFGGGGGKKENAVMISYDEMGRLTELKVNYYIMLILYFYRLN